MAAPLDVRVDRATDPDRFLASDKLVWFDTLGEEPTELQLRGVPADQRFAAEVIGSRRRPRHLPRDLRRTAHAALGPRRSRCGRTVPFGGLTWVGRPPRPPPARPADRDDAPPLRADPPRGRSPLGAARERTRHLRPARLRAGLPRAGGGARPRHDVHRARTSRTRSRRISTRLHTITDKGVTERRREVDLALLAECVGVDRRRRGVLRDDGPPDGRGEARRRAAPDPVRGARRPRPRLRGVQAQAQVEQREAGGRGVGRGPSPAAPPPGWPCFAA